MLKGATALVAGATGEVGRGAAYALSQAGAFVFLTGRSEEKLKAIQDTLPNKQDSHVISVDYSTTEGAKAFAEKVAALGKKFDVVVSASGPWWPINQIAQQGDIDMLYNAVQANFTTQLFLFKILAPMCKPDGHYLMVNGAAAVDILGTGLTGVTANACLGAAKLMNDECSKSSALPKYTHVLLSSSVGHAQFRGGNTHDPNKYGKVFVAMALDKHASAKDSSGTLMLDDTMYEKLVAML
ncbi:hypothetical protein ACA910_009225 [Epithemia clementina (nom. ined.)]